MAQHAQRDVKPRCLALVDQVVDASRPALVDELDDCAGEVD